MPEGGARRRSARAAYLKPGTETAAYEARKAIVRAMVRVAPEVLQALTAPEVVAAWERAEPHLYALRDRPRLDRGPGWGDLCKIDHADARLKGLLRPDVAARAYLVQDAVGIGHVAALRWGAYFVQVAGGVRHVVTLRGLLQAWGSRYHLDRAEWLMDLGVQFLVQRPMLAFWAPAGTKSPFMETWEVAPDVSWPEALVRAPLEESRLTAEGLYRHRQELARRDGLPEDVVLRQEEGMEPPWPSTDRAGIREWNPLVQAESDAEGPRSLTRATGQEAKRRGYVLARDLPELDRHAEWFVENQLLAVQAGESADPAQDSLAARYDMDAVTMRDAVKDLCRRVGYPYRRVGQPGRRKRG